jgi:hypothetical protein
VESAGIPVKMVVLYSSGVGYFQHSGVVHGDATAELRFKTSQINDVLKSLVIQDMDHGTIAGITYPSFDPVSKTLGSFQINIAENPSLHDLLNQLRGSGVEVDLGTEKVKGTILGVEMKEKPTRDEEKKVIEVPVLNLVVEGEGIRSVEMDQVHSVKLEDAELQSELMQALAAVAQARDKDKKPVRIEFSGKGDRHVSIGYVVETPVWKTSYRLVLPGWDGGKGQMEGWALVENQTDTDWRDVRLSLVSGRPISFVQDLYQPRYVQRPVVVAEGYENLVPQLYDSGVNVTRNVERQFGFQQQTVAAAAPMGMMAGRAKDVAKSEMDRPYFSAANVVNESVASMASGKKMGELFEYTIDGVSLGRQKSAMLPIVTDAVEVERVSIYNAGVLEKNPLNGAMVKNTTGKHWLGGPMTVFEEGGYAGDARVDDVPPGQSRMISFGVDLQVRVDAKSERRSDAIVAGKIVKGVLQVTRKHHVSQTYAMENKGDKDKTVVIEHPVQGGWKLVDTQEPMEKTEGVYRFKEKVAAGKTEKFTVQAEHVDGQEIEILPTDVGQLVVYDQSGEISKKVKEVLEKAIELKQAMAEADRNIHERDEKIQAMTKEQTRIRDNMQVVDRQSPYYKRLVDKLNDQETQIEGLRKEMDGFRETMEGKRGELEAYLSGVTVE